MRQRELLREHANLLVVPAQACAAGERIVEEVDDSKDESDSDDDGQLRAEVARRAAPRKVSSVVAPQESDFQRTVTCFHEDDDDQHPQSSLARSSLRGRPTLQRGEPMRGRGGALGLPKVALLPHAAASLCCL